MYLNKAIAYIFFIVLLCLSACKENKLLSNEEPLARVHDAMLYPSDIEGLVTATTSPADSTLIVGSYINGWVRDRLLVRKAKDNLAEDLDIDRLVENYRSSLLLNLYKENLLKEKLDTNITMQEMKTFYAENKERYELKDNIARCYYIKVERDVPERGTLNRWWTLRKDTYYANLVNYAKKYGVEYSMNDSIWIEFNELEAKLPKGAFNDKYYKKGDKDIYVKDRKYRYYLRLNEVRSAKKPAPFSYVQDDLSKVILKKKKMELLKKTEEELYEKALNKNNIEIY